MALKSPADATANVRRPTSVASILRPSPEDDDGEGPYFDLEFSIPEEDGSDSGSEDDEVTGGRLRPDPDDDLFFKGRSSLLFTPSSKPQFPSSLLKSATRFRVFMLRFKRSAKPSPPECSSKKEKQSKFSVKLKIEEVPIVSLFSRDSTSSSRSSSSGGGARSAKLYAEEVIQSPATASSDEKKNPKDVIHRYLSKIKPLYVRASKRCTDKVRLSSGQLTAGEPERGAHSGSLRIVSRRLRKSRSASAAVAAVRSPARRRDDSLTQQEDGIQSAIAHCKRSFNAGSDLGLARCRSDPGAERCN